jgi:hypothetical protein
VRWDEPKVKEADQPVPAGPPAPKLGKVVSEMTLDELQGEITRYEQGLPTLAADDARLGPAKARLEAMRARCAVLVEHQNGTSTPSPAASGSP